MCSCISPMASRIHTYLHNWSLQPSSQDYWPSFSHHLCCVCVKFIHKWRNLQFKVDSERQIFWETSWQFYLLSEFLAEICWEEIFRILFWCLAWGSNPGFPSTKPTHYLLDHGDIIDNRICKLEWVVCHQVLFHLGHWCKWFSLAILIHSVANRSALFCGVWTVIYCVVKKVHYDCKDIVQ